MKNPVPANLASLILLLSLAGCTQPHTCKTELGAGTEWDYGLQHLDGVPSVIITSPVQGQLLTDSKAPVEITVNNYDIRRGSAVYLLLDKIPFARITALDQQLLLPELTPGAHTIHAILVRPWQESLKNPEAVSSVRFFIGQQVTTGTHKESPTLLLVAPDGFYSDPLDGQLLVDFRVIPPDDTYYIRLRLNDGEPIEIHHNNPFWLKGLPIGTYTVEATLINSRGEPVPENSTLRYVRIK